MLYERITDEDKYNGDIRERHEYRYKLAGELTRKDDYVLDAACGSGYGESFLKGRYVGVDISPLRGEDMEVDLEIWQPRFCYEVFVGLETIEHLGDYSNYVEIAKRARRSMIISTPIVPTTHINNFHEHDFTAMEIIDIFTDKSWRIVYHEEQDKKTGIFIFKKINK